MAQPVELETFPSMGAAILKPLWENVAVAFCSTIGPFAVCTATVHTHKPRLWNNGGEPRSQFSTSRGRSYAAASAALNFTLTRRLTPGSCMVTP
jgi:hypothetical protein